MRLNVLPLTLALVSGCETRVGSPSGRETAERYVVPAATAQATPISGEGQTCFVAGGWRFVWRFQGELGLPLEAFVSLYAERNGQAALITGPKDVQGLPGVRILSSDQALSFVRLFTQKNTFHRFLEPAAFEYTDAHAKVMSEKGKYVIVRRLLYPRELPSFGFELSHQDSFPVYEVRETLFPDASYSCERLMIVDWVEKHEVNIQRIE